VIDPGAKMLSAIATVIDADAPEEIDKVIETIEDPAGTFYRTSLPHALINKKVYV
jgi:F420-non-reducing hydrogenase small subunit